MKNQFQNNEDFTGMKKEDNRYGDLFHKTHTEKDHNKKDKYVKKYANMKIEDLNKKDENEYEYDDGYKSIED